MQMDILYRSTRGNAETVTASQAILKGLADDGGLFVPERIPALDVDMDTLAGMTYQEVAYEVMSRFLTDFTKEELQTCIARAYDENLIPMRSPRCTRRTARISWSFSTAPPSLLKIWLFPSCPI